MSDTNYLCESCGHPAHHSATAGQHCPVITYSVDSQPLLCKCPSTVPAGPDCACHGEMWWLRKHTDSSCDDDYPCNDPNCCHFVWDGLPDEACDGKMGHEMWCHKRKGHGGAHSTHNDCGHTTAEGHTCGNFPAHEHQG